jgi:hypothetical protein
MRTGADRRLPPPPSPNWGAVALVIVLAILGLAILYAAAFG